MNEMKMTVALLAGCGVSQGGPHSSIAIPAGWESDSTASSWTICSKGVRPGFDLTCEHQADSVSSQGGAKAKCGESSEGSCCKHHMAG